jgi:Pentapeptide repeats (8 copies)
MRWLRRDIWKLGIALVGLLLLLVLMVWVPFSVASTSVGASGLAISRSVQATPTEDATVTALQKEQLILQNKQLQQSDDRGFSAWLWSNAAAIVASFLSTLVVVIGALIGFRQWRTNREDARRKEVEAQDKDLKAQAEERFRAAVTALGSENEATQVGGAILLRSFLNKKDEKVYGRYYTQIFDLAVAYLRFQRTSDPKKDPFRQALIVVFKEALPIVRNKLIADGADREDAGVLPSLDASRIQLDHASLRWADLKQVWMPSASLQKAILFKADLTGARLKWADLTGVNLLEALSLKNTDLREVKGLTKEQLEACKARGARIDDDTTTSPPQPTVPPPPQQSS